MTEIKVGSRVCFSRKFLQSTMQFTGRVPFAVGSVEALEDLGGDLLIAFIRWDDGIEGRVNVKNLILLDRKHLEPV